MIRCDTDSNTAISSTADGPKDLVLGIVVGVVAAVLTAWLTRQGMTTFNDSATYLSVAHHLTGGEGLTAAAPYTNSSMPMPAQLASDGRFPMTGWPPGYPLILAVVMQFGFDAMTAARIVAILSAGILTMAVFVGGRRLFGLSRAASLVVAGLTLVAPNVADADFGPMMGRRMVAAESVFIPLVVLTMLVGMTALKRSSPRWIAATCLLIGACTLTRATGPIYGLSLAIGGLIVPTRLGRDDFRHRLRVAGALGLSGMVTSVGWSLARRLLYGPSPSVRSVGWYGASGVIAIVVKVMAGWFGVPFSAPMILQLVVAGLVVVLPIVVVFRLSTRRRLWPGSTDVQRALVTASVAIVVTIIVVLVTCVVLDRTLLPDARHLAPVQPLAYLVTASVFTTWLDHLRNHGSAWLCASRQTVLVVVLGLVCGAGAASSVWSGRDVPVKGSPLRAELTGLRGLGDDVRIVTNMPDAVWLASRRTSLVLPPERYFTSMTPNPNFRTDLDEVGRLADHEPVVIVVSSSLPYPTDKATSWLADRYGFEPVAHCGSEVTIWANGLAGADRQMHDVCS